MAEPLTRSRDAKADADPAELDPNAHARAVAEYLGDMVGQLESMARQQGFDLLVYLLSMARVEAETTARAKGSRRRSS